MIDFTSVAASHDINTDFILSKLDESQIFSYYFGYFELNKLYPSKLRTDRHPSTSFFISTKTGSLLYKDFASNKVYNCFMFVAALYNTSFIEAMNIIARDFGLVNINTLKPEAAEVLKNVNFDKQIKAQTVIQISPGSWDAEHINYWKEYYIDIQKLKDNNVYRVKRLFVNKREFEIDNLCFAYLVKNEDETGYHEYLKIYQPLKTTTTGKWINNVPITVPFGLYELKADDKFHIAIGKAKKDEMVLQNFFTSTIGTQNESEAALPPDLIDKLTANFDRRTIIWDADSAGVEACKKFNEFGFDYFNTPSYLLDRGIKDVSDYVKAFGMKALERLLKSKGII